MIIIFLFFFLVLPVYASEIDINYKWYKYSDSTYMSLSESKNIESYIDYNDYIVDEYFDINSYNEISGRYIYIYNKTGKTIDSIESIKVYDNGNNVTYKARCQFADIHSMNIGGLIMLDMKGARLLKNIELEINYEGGDLLISFSNTGSLYDAGLAQEKINASGKYKFSHLKNHQEIKYKTYYNRIDGVYAKESYGDFIYKDSNDYKINYFFYKKTIDRIDIQILDIIDTNYTFVRYEGNIDYNTNGKYKLKLIFSECEKEIEVVVDIKEDEELEKIKNELDGKNKKIEELNIIVENKDKTINELNTSLENMNDDLNNKNKKIEELNIIVESKDKTINELNTSLENMNDELDSKNKKIEELNIIVENKDKTINELKSSLEKIKNKNKIINELKKKISNLEKNNKIKIKELNKQIKMYLKNITKYEKEISESETIINKLNNKIEQLNKEINSNKKIYELNKNNYKKIVILKNSCFNELKEYKKTIDYLDNKYTTDKEYYERYIKKIKYVIDEKNHDYWNIKKRSIFVGFITNH